MKKLFVATAALALAAVGSAGAADLPVKAPPMAPPPPPTWTGCWISGGVGYGMWNQQHFGETFPGLVQDTNEFTSGGEGWLGRVGAGCDYQFNGGSGFLSNFLIGIQGDYDWTDIKSDNFADAAGVGAFEKQSNQWSIGGRVGWIPYPNLLTFVSGGYTQAHFNRQDLFDTTVFPAVPLTVRGVGTFIDGHTYSGGYIGGGYEYRIPWWQTVNLTWKTEYRYSWLGSADLPILLDNGLTTGEGEHMRKHVQTVTTSLVWRFNWWGGPVVARY